MLSTFMLNQRILPRKPYPCTLTSLHAAHESLLAVAIGVTAVVMAFEVLFLRSREEAMRYGAFDFSFVVCFVLAKSGRRKSALCGQGWSAEDDATYLRSQFLRKLLEQYGHLSSWSGMERRSSAEMIGGSITEAFWCSSSAA